MANISGSNAILKMKANQKQVQPDIFKIIYWNCNKKGYYSTDYTKSTKVKN